MKQLLSLVVVIIIVVGVFSAMWYVSKKTGPAMATKPFHACSGSVCVDADQLQLNPQGTCAVLDGKTVMCGTFSVITNK